MNIIIIIFIVIFIIFIIFSAVWTYTSDDSNEATKPRIVQISNDPYASETFEDGTLKGYVSIMTCNSLPNTIIIQSTLYNPNDLAKYLSESTSLPSPFKVEFAYPAGSSSVLHMRICEELKFKRIKEKRLNKQFDFNWEDIILFNFFSISLEEARDAIISQAEEDVDLFRKWDSPYFNNDGSVKKYFNEDVSTEKSFKEWVYVLSNESMPNMVKIGYTTLNPENRSDELSRSTGVPTSFEVNFAYPTNEGRLLERLAHKKLEYKRVNSNREFFNIDIKEAIRVISSVAEQYEL